MSDFEFHGTPDERRMQGEMLMLRVYRDLYGNGTPGILSRIEASMTKRETEEVEREKQHTQNRFRLNIIIGILSVLCAYLALFRGHF